MRLGVGIFLLINLGLAALGQSAGDTYRFAYDQGFSDGETAGQSDRMNQQGYDYSKWPEFLMGDKGADETIHDLEVYTVAYRRGFKDGYENGFSNQEAETGEPAESGETVPVAEGSEESLGSTGGKSEWTIPEGTRIMVRLLDPLSTEMNQTGDEFLAELAEDIPLVEENVIPEGARIHGIISHLKRAGRIRGRAEMELQFNRLEIRPGYSVSFKAEMVGLSRVQVRDVETDESVITKESEVNEDVGRIGVSSGIGALIGVITGGAAGAGKGAIVGAAGGVVGTILSRGDDIRLLTETEILIQLVDDLELPREEFVK